MKTVRTLIIMIMTITLAITSSAALASAHSIDGIGGVNDDWSDNHTISNSGTYNTGNLIGVWQAVLWADNKLAGSGCSYVDGLFGANTETATINWQQTFFPSQPSQWDGIVGTNTWSVADNQLATLTATTVRYTGNTRNLTFTRATSGTYTWTWNGNTNRNTTHPTPALGC